MTGEEERSIEGLYGASAYGEPSIQVPPREHLGTERRPGVCCDHLWDTVPEESKEEALRRLDERDLDVGSVRMCVRCRAVAAFGTEPNYLGQDMAPWIWAYDATVPASEPPRRERRDSLPHRPRR